LVVKEKFTSTAYHK